MTGEEGNHRDDSLFYGNLRSDDAALSEDGRFMAMCWYEDKFEIDWGLGSRHSWNPNGVEEDGVDNDINGSSVYWKDMSDDEIYKEYAIDVGRNRSVQFSHFRDHPSGQSLHFWPCSILSKHDDEDTDAHDENRYIVRIFPSYYHLYFNGDESLAANLLLENYPRSSIRFVTVPYQGDQYHRKAFRHHMEIKDELFPEKWKNKQ